MQMRENVMAYKFVKMKIVDNTRTFNISTLSLQAGF